MYSQKIIFLNLKANVVGTLNKGKQKGNYY